MNRTKPPAQPKAFKRAKSETSKFKRAKKTFKRAKRECSESRLQKLRLLAICYHSPLKTYLMECNDEKILKAYLHPFDRVKSV